MLLGVDSGRAGPGSLTGVQSPRRRSTRSSGATWPRSACQARVDSNRCLRHPTCSRPAARAGIRGARLHSCCSFACARSSLPDRTVGRSTQIFARAARRRKVTATRARASIPVPMHGTHGARSKRFVIRAYAAVSAVPCAATKKSHKSVLLAQNKRLSTAQGMGSCCAPRVPGARGARRARNARSLNARSERGSSTL